MVDNLSDGRVALAFASGWQPNDFVLAPDRYEERREVLQRGIEQVRGLWRGEPLTRENPAGDAVEVRTLPRPVQPELPVWLTTAGDVESWKRAGQLGANVLTHLLGQSLEQVADKIRTYRDAHAKSGAAGRGTVTIMLHTLVGEDDAVVRELVREPMKRYLGSSVSLIKGFASSFPFRTLEGQRAVVEDFDLGALNDEEMDALLEHSFERYFQSSGLFGSVERCAAIVDELKGIDIDEIACLLDFGVDQQIVLDSLGLLDALRERAKIGRASCRERV